MTTGIYSITNTRNGRVYVGSAANVLRRWYVHRSDLRAGKHRNSHLQRAWLKYGESAFEFVVLEVTTVADLLAREQAWIDALHACDSRKGYNLSVQAGAPMQGRKHRPDTLVKMSRAQTGHAMSPEARQKLAVKATGRTLTDEHRAKIAAAGVGRKMPPRTEEWKHQQSERMRGRTLTEEHRANIRKSSRQHHAEQSQIARDYIVTTPTGDEIEVHNLKSFCRDHDLAISSMRKVVKGITHQHKGWKCRYKP